MLNGTKRFSVTSNSQPKHANIFDTFPARITQCQFISCENHDAFNRENKFFEEHEKLGGKIEKSDRDMKLFNRELTVLFGICDGKINVMISVGEKNSKNCAVRGKRAIMASSI